MQFSESWLRALVNPSATSAELSHQLTMAGLEVEALQPVAPAFTRVVVAHILSAERHPDADRLQVCTVDVGDPEPLQIVCGAPNARAGLKSACALVGAELPNDFKIKRAKVRGVESLGMMCSARELGMEAEADGILEFPADAPVGQSVREYLDLDDQLFTLKLTPNRGDCLSIAGVAREVAALTGTELTLPAPTEVAVASAETVAVTIADSAACPVYCARVVAGINPASSTPAYMRRRLLRSGVRPIHPVVDVTNFVLLELGQPMHAFDRSKLNGSISVRQAEAGERIALLNDTTADLLPGTLLIADAQGPVAMAGIMGGADSAVDAQTTTVVLEAAHFSVDTMAGQARRYGLSTDSSHRFERGVDPSLPVLAMARATALLLEICGGQAGPVVQVGEGVRAHPPIRFRPERARRLLGMAIADAEMRQTLTRLAMPVEEGAEAWAVTPPSWRFDLAIEQDLVEEVARVAGYDRLESCVPLAGMRMLPASETVLRSAALKSGLVARGWQEVVSYSFIAEAEAEPFLEGRAPIRLKNPIASQMAVMRPSLMPGLLQTLSHNLNRGLTRLRIFEIGRSFQGVEADAQPPVIAALIYGDALPEQWGAAARNVDFFDLKAELVAIAAAPLDYRAADLHPALHPTQAASLWLNDRRVGHIGALHPRLVQAMGLPRPPVLFELELAALAATGLPRFQSLQRLQSVRRDLAVVVDETVTSAQMLNAVWQNPPASLESIELFDVYRGTGLDAGKKSLAFKMLLKHTDANLTDVEIDAAMQQVLQQLQLKCAATLRS
jgi:phenylalanyl-tRNA synthetase beta chain